MPQQAIILKGLDEKPEVSTSKSITTARDEAIKSVKTVLALKTITDAAGLQTAADAHRKLRGILKTVETARTTVKAPVIALGKEIDAAARTFVAEAERLAGQLQGMINNYQLRQLREQEAEEARVANEKANQGKAVQAELTALQNELAKGRVSKKRHEEISNRVFDLELMLETLGIQAEETQLATTTPGQEVKGVSSKVVYDFELAGTTEAEKAKNLYAFVQAYPELCNIDIKRRATLDKLNSGGFTTSFPEDQPLPPDYVPRVPGLRVFQTAKTRVS